MLFDTLIQSDDLTATFLSLNSLLKQGDFEAVDTILVQTARYLQTNNPPVDRVLNILMAAAPTKAQAHLPSLPEVVQTIGVWLFQQGFEDAEVKSLLSSYGWNP